LLFYNNRPKVFPLRSEGRHLNLFRQ